MQEHPSETSLDLSDPGKQRVLVAVMNNRRDFEIARTQGWYRIPVVTAPAQIAAEYLALYFTKAFGSEKWSIRYYAPIRRFCIVRRQDLLPQEPGHPRAQRQYYKIEIGPLQPLPQPIPSRRLRRITFIPTTLERLLHAQEINDLWEADVLKERLWAELQRQGIEAEREYLVQAGRVAYILDFAVLCRQGNLGIECGSRLGHASVTESDSFRSYFFDGKGWEILRFAASELEENLAGCINQVIRYVEKHGGLALLSDAPDWYPCD